MSAASSSKTTESRKHEKSCQALFSRGIERAKSLMVRSHRGNRKSRFSKMVMCGRITHSFFYNSETSMETVHLQHKHGGRITAIHSVNHSMHEGVADWYFVGDIEWRDGGKSVGTEIPPWAVCFDHDNEAAHAECNAAFKAMNEYLVKHGKWHNPKPMKDGRMVSWTPKKKEFAVAL